MISLAGVVRAHVAAKAVGIRVITGARLDLEDGASLLCLPTDRTAYGQLTRLLTLGKRRAGKAECRLTRADVWGHAEGQILIVVPPDGIGREDGEIEFTSLTRPFETAQERFLRVRAVGDEEFPSQISHPGETAKPASRRGLPTGQASQGQKDISLVHAFAAELADWAAVRWVARRRHFLNAASPLRVSEPIARPR